MSASSQERDAAYRDWCQKDGVATLQRTSVFPPRSIYQASETAQPLHRTHQRAVSMTPAGAVKAPHTMKTDHMATYYPPAHIQPKQRDPTKFDALGRTSGWAPHNANPSGSQRAIYDPVSHKTTLYTFDSSGGVSWIEGRGDTLVKEKKQRDLNEGPRGAWAGRRKGVVEFVDRTHFYAVNQNDAFLQTCAKNEHAYHTPTGELTKWMDNAFASKMKVPFYGKHPHEMNR